LKFGHIAGTWEATVWMVPFQWICSIVQTQLGKKCEWRSNEIFVHVPPPLPPLPQCSVLIIWICNNNSYYPKYNSSSFNKGSIYNLFLFLIKLFKKTRILIVFSDFKYCNKYFSIGTNIFFHVACRNLDHNYFNGTLNMVVWDQNYLLHGVFISMVNNNISGLEPSWDDKSLIYSPVL
jgi:hypothetical protein